MLKPSYLVLIALIPFEARAFDPFTLGVGMGAMDSALDSAGEAADMGEAMLDLMNESEVDESLVKEMEANVKRLEELQSTLRNAKSTSQDLQNFLDFDLSRSKTLASKVRNVASKMRQGKRLLGMFNKKTAQTGLQIESVRLNYRILDELRNIRLQEFSRYFQEKEKDARLRVAIEKTLKEEQKHVDEMIRKFPKNRRLR